MDDIVKPQARKRLELTTEMYWLINKAIAERIDIDLEQPIESLHATITIEIVKGRFTRILPTPSILVEDKRRARKIA